MALSNRTCESATSVAFAASDVSSGSFIPLRVVPPEHLAAVVNEARNVVSGAENGLRMVGEMMGAHDPSVRAFDHSGVGWLIEHLNEELSEAREFIDLASSRLLALGYDDRGQPLDPATWRQP